MKNSVTERIPYQWYEIDAIEGWLDEHVRQGLRLVSISGFGRALFVPSTGSLTRYRIHVKPERGISHDDEYRATFAQSGWEFVDSINAQADVYQAVRPDAVEINTDEEVLRSVIDRAVRNQWILIAVFIVSILFWCYQQIKSFSLFLEHGIYDFLIHEVILIPLALGLLIVWLTALAAIIRNLRTIKKRRFLNRDFHTPQELQHRKRQNRRLLIIDGILLAMCFTCMLFFDGSDRLNRPVPPCPVADLSAINAEEYEQVPHYLKYESRSDYLFSTYYHYDCMAEFIHPSSGGGYHPFKFSARVNEIRIESWVVPYLRETLDNYDDPWQQVEISGWDEAWYQSYGLSHDADLILDEGNPIPPERGHRLYLLDGNTIIYISYYGATDLYPRLQELYRK